MHGLGAVAAAFGRERPEPRAGLVDVGCEVPRAGLPRVVAVTVANDRHAHARRHAVQELDEVIGARLRVREFAPHACRAVDEDRKIHRALGDRGEVSLEGDERGGVERCDAVRGEETRALRFARDERCTFVARLSARLAVPLAPAVVARGVAAAGDGRESAREHAGLGAVHAQDDATEEFVHPLADRLVVRAVECSENLECEHRLERTRGLLCSCDAPIDQIVGDLVSAAQDRPEHAFVPLCRKVLGPQRNAATREHRIAVGPNAPRGIARHRDEPARARLAVVALEPHGCECARRPGAAACEPVQRLRLLRRRLCELERRGCRRGVACGGRGVVLGCLVGDRVWRRFGGRVSMRVIWRPYAARLRGVGRQEAAEERDAPRAVHHARVYAWK